MTREDRITERIRAIPEGFVRTYGDIGPARPALRGPGTVRDRRRPALAAGRPRRRSLPKGAKQPQLLLREGVPMRGERVDMKEARFPPDL
jgi:methylated-DNA-protein-cysteine methyltransferase-like protein